MDSSNNLVPVRKQLNKANKEMVSYLKKFVGWIYSKLWTRELEISIIGLQNAGKSTLTNTLATGEFDEDSIPTIGFNFRRVRKGKVSFSVWDLGGQERFRESWEKYCRQADCIIFVVDSVDLATMDESRRNLHTLLDWPTLQGIPLLILGNKNDLDGALTEEELIEELNLRRVQNRQVACFSISAKNQVNLDITVQWLSEQPARANKARK